MKTPTFSELLPSRDLEFSSFVIDSTMSKDTLLIIEDLFAQKLLL